MMTRLTVPLAGSIHVVGHVVADRDLPDRAKQLGVASLQLYHDADRREAVADQFLHRRVGPQLLLEDIAVLVEMANLVDEIRDRHPAAVLQDQAVRSRVVGLDGDHADAFGGVQRLAEEGIGRAVSQVLRTVLWTGEAAQILCATLGMEQREGLRRGKALPGQERGAGQLVLLDLGPGAVVAHGVDRRPPRLAAERQLVLVIEARVVVQPEHVVFQRDDLARPALDLSDVEDLREIAFVVLSLDRHDPFREVELFRLAAQHNEVLRLIGLRSLFHIPGTSEGVIQQGPAAYLHGMPCGRRPRR
jgi:hypothetical protein